MNTNGLVNMAIDVAFDYLEDNINDLPETIKRLRNSPEIEQKIAVLWSEHLFEKGLVPRGYNGLPDNLLIKNFHQTGYLDGLYVGYILAMMALADNDAPNDIIIAARDYIRPNLMGHHYDDKDEFISQYKDEKYSWIDSTGEPYMKCNDCGRTFNIEKAREEFNKNGLKNHSYDDFLKNYGQCDWCAINYLNQLKTGQRVSYEKIPMACRACINNLKYPDCEDDCIK